MAATALMGQVSVRELCLHSREQCTSVSTDSVSQASESVNSTVLRSDSVRAPGALRVHAATNTVVSSPELDNSSVKGRECMGKINVVTVPVIPEENVLVAKLEYREQGTMTMNEPTCSNTHLNKWSSVPEGPISVPALNFSP